MSIIYYSGGSVTPLRGEDVSNALIELLSITRWGELDFLILDMPPGIGDATLDLLRLIKGIQFLIVTTSSVLAFETVKKLAGLLESLKIPVIGVVENMKMDQSNIVRNETEKLGLKLLGEIPYDAMIEKAIGDVGSLRRTMFARKVEEIGARIR
jgi:ATP-binding protein involved in chromosome partitioning